MHSVIIFSSPSSPILGAEGATMFHAQVKRGWRLWVIITLMNNTYPIAAVGELIGENARAAILIALLDEKVLPAGELARVAGVSAQSASGHLSKLVDGGLLRAETSGRQRLYRIAKPEVAYALEALGTIATASPVQNMVRDPRIEALRAARSCYDHLAGRVAVELRQKLESSNLIRAREDRRYEVSPRGEAWFAKLGVNVVELRLARRSFARECLDWTERTPHLAGALGAAILSRFLALGWVARRPKTRAVRITHRGAREFQARFGILVSP
jgi:DNA-binding transcriptional ArsR family regulator